MLCSLGVSLLVPPVNVGSSSQSHTNVCHRRSCLVPLTRQRVPAHSRPRYWGKGCGPYRSQVMSVGGSTGCISQVAGICGRLSLSTTSTSILSLSLNCRACPGVQGRLDSEKRSFIQALWKGHAHNGNIMLQWDGRYGRFACTAAVILLQFCGATPSSP